MKRTTGRFTKIIFYFLQAHHQKMCNAIATGKPVNLRGREEMQIPCKLNFSGQEIYQFVKTSSDFFTRNCTKHLLIALPLYIFSFWKLKTSVNEGFFWRDAKFGLGVCQSWVRLIRVYTQEFVEKVKATFTGI